MSDAQEPALRNYYELIESVDGIVWEADASSFMFTFVSKQAERLLGYPVERWYEKGFWLDHIHPEDQEGAIGHCIQCTRAMKPHEMEYRMIAADGRQVWLRDIISVIVEDGKPAKLRGIMVDVTRQKAIEQALVRSEHRFLSLVDSNILVVFVADAESRQILEANQAFLDFLGYTREELVQGKINWSDFTAPEFRERDDVAIRHIQESGSTAPYEKKLIRKGGGSVYALFGGTLLQGDQILGIAVDITDRKRLLQEMQKAHERNAFLAEFGKSLSQSLDPVEVLQLSSNGLVKQSCDWCLISLVQEGGPVIAACAHRDPALRPMLTTWVSQQAAEGPCQSEPHLLQALNAVIRTGKSVLISAMEHEDPVLNRLGCGSILILPLVARAKVIGAAILVKSRSESDFSREELLLAEAVCFRAALAILNAKLYEEARESIRLREEFLSIASHELRTPLTPLKLQLELLREFLRTGKLNELPIDRILEVAGQQIDRLSALINDLLDVSRIRAGRMALHPKEMDLVRLITDVVSRYHAEIQAAGTKVELQLPEQLVGVFDPLRMEQVVENLLSNAIKYGSQRPISIRLEREDGERVLFSVQDRGIGIAPESVQRIFGRFERAVMPGQFGGLGLGLYIVRQIVESHGGRIWVDTQLGQGSAFFVELPLRQAEARPAEAA